MSKKIFRIKATVEQWRKAFSPVCDNWTKGATYAMLSIAVWKAFSPGCNPNEAYPVIAGHLTQVRPD